MFRNSFELAIVFPLFVLLFLSLCYQFTYLGFMILVYFCSQDILWNISSKGYSYKDMIQFFVIGYQTLLLSITVSVLSWLVVILIIINKYRYPRNDNDHNPYEITCSSFYIHSFENQKELNWIWKKCTVHKSCIPVTFRSTHS